ncbi:long-chain-fatty-acid--CoA ligase [Eikenella longinqua]|uniref:Long-chain-fatty-acid--CoA ligase n=1 Tax=Eikenella longinqua TaxID=1795827 RepID=A0A1A9RUS1_9NEIS|nr:AMP-binding protein [Eikenella longinqua]OAM26329.1 long-chain-fatty-acid--CoA ligase [Eikenella longinqua]
MEKIWLQSYQEGVRPEIDVRRYGSICDVFSETVAQYGNRPGFTNFGTVQTYAETARLAEQFASYLQNVLKLEKGSRVAVMMPNLLQYPVAVFGILQAGCIVVNVNPLYTPRELQHQLKDSGATTILVLENFAHTLSQVVAGTQVQHIILASIGDLLGFFKGTLVNLIVRYVKKMVPPYRLLGAVRFNRALRQGAAHTFRHVPITLKDTAFLQYTGGTTGVSKGAMLSHGNICANMLQAEEWIQSNLSTEGELVVTALPMYHVFALTVNLMIFTRIGAQNLLITNPRDIRSFIKELKKYRVSVLPAVNTLFNALLNHPDFRSVDFSSWKLCLGGGMAVQESVAQQWKALTGQPIVEVYGLTEASPGVCANPLNISEYNGTIGLPVSNTDIEIRDEHGRQVPIGEIGELCIKGPQIMQGYWQHPEETAAALDENGFLATGDMVKMDEKGFIKLVDRKKDMIVVSGFNVYPNEVEEVVTRHAMVLEAACIGVPSNKTGEMLKLFVVKKNPALTREELISFCRLQLTAYKVPKDIEFRDELPKSNVGKILRRELREQA